MEENEGPPRVPAELSSSYRDARDHAPELTWNYAAKGFLRRGETSVLYGPSNCGKSAIVCHLGHCIITGSAFFGARVTQGLVLHVGAEAPNSILDRLQAYDLRQEEQNSYIVRMNAVDLSNPGEVAAFVADAKRIYRHTGQKIVLVVFDTLARSIGTFDENCASSMTGVADAGGRIADALKAHVMFVHHTGKDTDRGGRGSSALRGAVDTELALKPLEGGAVLLSQEKQRTMPKGEAVRFKTKAHVLGQDEDGEDRTTVTATELEGGAPVPEGRRASKDSIAIEMAVRTSLHIRRMTGEHAVDEFQTRDLLKTLPPELFGRIADDSRMKSVRRCLLSLARERSPVVRDSGNGWKLVVEHNVPEVTGL
ncbi:AAA family ATPase [Tropicimonas sp. IMCC34011]|uniref:AAA family ATPase n=1 Tax=Tropicimonas sp. IMCC34011 TaxID=2248759 RepID=UPI000E247C1E|nr:AAA family ATPase [Tropicimonas sp. IMCC34011]